jgi:hypothetical protein
VVGETFTVHPGEVLVAEGNAGSGHKWRLVNNDPWKRAYVVFKQGADTRFIPDPVWTCVMDQDCNNNAMTLQDRVDLVLGVARVLYVNGQSTEQVVASAESFGHVLGLRAGIMPRWGELQLEALFGLSTPRIRRASRGHPSRGCTMVETIFLEQSPAGNPTTFAE